MNDALKIFNLYLEGAIKQEQPKLSVDRYGNKKWRLNGKLHRTDGPAHETRHGTKEWRLHGELHRDGAPAIERDDGSKLWYQHGKIHREDGPAYEWEDDDSFKGWFLNDVEYDSQDKWAEALLKQRNEPHDAMAVDAFLKTLLRKDIEMAL